MAYPQALSGLSTREQIADTVVRGCLAFDSNDKPLFESVWAAGPDIALDINGNVMKGLENMNKNCFDRVGPMVCVLQLFLAISSANCKILSTNVLPDSFPWKEESVPGQH